MVLTFSPRGFKIATNFPNTEMSEIHFRFVKNIAEMLIYYLLLHYENRTLRRMAPLPRVYEFKEIGKYMSK